MKKLLSLVFILLLTLSVVACDGSLPDFNNDDGDNSSNEETSQEDAHKHNYGAWVKVSEDSNATCEESSFCRTCSTCNNIEFKKGSFNDHQFETVTTPPTCVADGYDTRICSLCGKAEVIKTYAAAHNYPTTYKSDNKVHWSECLTCKYVTDKTEHIYDKNGVCMTCGAVQNATLGEINYNSSKTAISVNDELNASLFGATCYYSDGRSAQIDVTYSGTVAAGETIIVRLSVSDGDTTKQITIKNVKVYGAPTLTYDENVSWVNITSGLTANAFSASATDSFGSAAGVTVNTANTATPGTLTTVVITATDIAGNQTVKTVENVKVYSSPVITYDKSKNYISTSDVLNADSFSASAIDSFGKACDIVVESGSRVAGQTTAVKITATDELGNANSIIITNVKVYGTPVIYMDEFIFENTDIEFIVTVYDSFGKELTPEIKCTGTLADGERVEITVKATDSVGNIVEETYVYVVNHNKHNWVDGYCDVCEKQCPYTRDGNYIYFGEYPQSIKADNVTITTAVDDRGYYLGSDGNYYAKVVADPYSTSYTFSSGSEITKGEAYYFKVEPIRWRILSSDDETALILCDSIIANMAYRKDYSNNYKNSDVRAWLNATFYETAFDHLQRSIILTTTVDNSVASTGHSSNPHACEDTEDKIFLLSYSEVTNSSYGFASSASTYDTARRMKTSDYSRATGAYMSTNGSGNGRWWLRSPDIDSGPYARDIYLDGQVSNYTIGHSGHGVVPALRIKL